jgi:MFS transporter, DHA1 family, tetracycline resistance protein
VLKRVFGDLSDRIGPKPAMIGGLVAFAVASAGFVVAGQAEGRGAARLAQGAAAAAFSPASGAALAALGGRKPNGRLFGGYGGAKSRGYLAGPLVGGLLVASSGYALLFGTLAVLAAFTAAAAALTVPTIPLTPRARESCLI